MEDKLFKFCQVLRLLEDNSAVLSAASVYCIGQCVAKRGDYPPAHIVDLVKKLAESAAAGLISEGLRTIAELYISEGDVEKAGRILENNVSLFHKRSRDPGPAAAEDMKRLRLDEEHTAATTPNIEEKPTSPDPPPALNCSICLENIPEEDYLPLERCGCIFHQSCVLAYISTAITQHKYPITCPQAKCKAEIHPLDMKERLPAQLYQQLEKTQLDAFMQRNGREIQHCPTPDCPFAFSWTGENPRFKCPACLKIWCLLCKKEYHDGISCKEYNQLTDEKALDQQFETVIGREGFQLCPTCNAWVEKIDGCNVVRCVCETEFCYECGVAIDDCECGGE